LKNQLLSNGISIDENLLELEYRQESSFYVYDHDGIKIQFIFL